MLEWAGGEREKEEEDEEAEQSCAWGGTVMGGLGGCRVMYE